MLECVKKSDDMFKESERVELKSAYTKTVLKEIVAFANTQGGKIYIGVSDDDVVLGIENTKELIESLSSAIVDGIRPSTLQYVNLSTIVHDEKEVVLIEVKQGSGKPYYLSSKGMRPEGVYARLGNTSVPVSERDIREMIVKHHGLSYETTRSYEQSLTFDYAKKEFHIRNIPFEMSHMITLKLFDDERLYTNLAYLISDQCPHIIKSAIFETDDKTKFRHRQEFSGSLLKQLNDVYHFITTQNHMKTAYDGLRRVDVYDYDLNAIRETLINAIVHRDYSLGGSIFVNVYSNSIEFVSLGTLPSGLYLEDIYEGVSKPRNENLANLFYRLELIEAYGTGIQKILHAYQDRSEKPVFKVTPNAFIVRLPKMIHDEVREEEAVYHTKNYNPYDKESVLQYLVDYIKKNGMITRKDVEMLLQVGQTKSGLLLKELEARSIIKRKGKGKNSHYVVEQ